MADYYDCTIKAGYYKLFGGPVGEHTFAIAEQGGETYAFPCFGSFALRENERGQTGVIYPAELWSPWMIGSQPQGKAFPANLYVALGMSQFTTTPRSDYRVQDWDQWWSSLPEALRGLSPSCNAGLLYAVNGVCQQACNRVLWAMRQDWFTYTSVNWPPSFSASYWVYGYYGKLTEGDAINLANELVREAKRRAGSLSFGLSLEADQEETKALAKIDQKAMKASLRKTHKALTTHRSERTRHREVKKMLEAAPGTDETFDSKKLGGLLAPDEKFNQLKTELDKQLLRAEVSHNEYAEQVNRAFGQMLDEFRNILPAETFKTLFRDAPESGPVEIIVRHQMPESYEAAQEQMHI